MALRLTILRPTRFGVSPSSSALRQLKGACSGLPAAPSLITPQIRESWQVALQAPLDLPPTWLHGDLHPRNVLVEQGAITGIIDWGDITAGDAATDLAALWMLSLSQMLARKPLQPTVVFQTQRFGVPRTGRSCSA
jgi:aminoglycoside phosphotransferase (APT) family kinase protein